MPSIKAICSIQEGALSANIKNQWQAKLEELYLQHLSMPMHLTLIWLSIPKGQAYLAGQADNTATLLVPVPNGTAQVVRAQFLYAVLDAWTELTGSKRDEVVISAANVELAEQFMRENQRRFAPLKRPVTVGRVMIKALLAKFKTGRLESNINL